MTNLKQHNKWTLFTETGRSNQKQNQKQMPSQKPDISKNILQNVLPKHIHVTSLTDNIQTNIKVIINTNWHFVTYFWIYLVFEMAFDTYFVFDLICLFQWIVYICYVVSTANSSQLVLIITLIFVWILSVKDVTWICFRRIFCNIFLDILVFWDGIWYIFVFDLICLF